MFRPLACGLLAGLAGTLAMDLVWYARYKRGNGQNSFLKWEFGSAPTSWDDASAPAKVGKLLYETATHSELGPAAIPVTTNLMHWGYGSQWGLVLALAIGNERMRLLQAPVLGALVWLASYVSLPIAGFYKPIWCYDPKTLWQDLSAHLGYGIGAAAGFKLTCRS
jgi:hypothetical protein